MFRIYCQRWLPIILSIILENVCNRDLILRFPLVTIASVGYIFNGGTTVLIIIFTITGFVQNIIGNNKESQLLQVPRHMYVVLPQSVYFFMTQWTRKNRRCD